ncbi:cob(I)yrinic acid a,c-diamide adenosyltransferase [Terrilactibacillus sp. BCM23-1]|uniref:Corrinoid adenosyltransferase n=1 Tax=Terrilactibacillus tamarindi TaxID=2599694 RepID=A0A6N8CSV9_9BACI|nr:cob(I)yrinic acid a,c-diamide adenosyltransferase [Terrilactibacillus tamarindi]MTT33262.1 cob(I)yrinic acid a,c-diamide adenosyltransferase [Terrilactibacillus tamarindi]
MKIYTRTGDKGTTSLVYGKRVAKNDPKVEAYGTCDEANSFLGLALSHLENTILKNDDHIKVLVEVQTRLFHVGSELSTPSGKDVQWQLTSRDVERLETAIDLIDKDLSPLKTFILPGGEIGASYLHVARTVVRRAERLTISLENINPDVLSYLNRLSDLLFVLARYVNMKLGQGDRLLHEN